MWSPACQSPKTAPFGSAAIAIRPWNSISRFHQLRAVVSCDGFEGLVQVVGRQVRRPAARDVLSTGLLVADAADMASVQLADPVVAPALNSQSQRKGPRRTRRRHRCRRQPDQPSSAPVGQGTPCSTIWSSRVPWNRSPEQPPNLPGTTGHVETITWSSDNGSVTGGVSYTICRLA